MDPKMVPGQPCNATKVRRSMASGPFIRSLLRVFGTPKLCGTLRTTADN